MRQLCTTWIERVRARWRVVLSARPAACACTERQHTSGEQGPTRPPARPPTAVPPPATPTHPRTGRLDAVQVHPAAHPMPAHAATAAAAAARCPLDHKVGSRLARPRQLGADAAVSWHQGAVPAGRGGVQVGVGCVWQTPKRGAGSTPVRAQSVGWGVPWAGPAAPCALLLPGRSPSSTHSGTGSKAPCASATGEPSPRGSPFRRRRRLCQPYIGPGDGRGPCTHGRRAELPAAAINRPTMATLPPPPRDRTAPQPPIPTRMLQTSDHM